MWSNYIALAHLHGPIPSQSLGLKWDLKIAKQMKINKIQSCREYILELRVCRVLALVQYASITFRIWASSSRATVPDGKQEEQIRGQG